MNLLCIAQFTAAAQLATGKNASNLPGMYNLGEIPMNPPHVIPP